MVENGALTAADVAAVMNGNRGFGTNGYSTHSIRDRAIAKLEEMFDEAQSRHEEQFIQDWIDRLSHDS